MPDAALNPVVLNLGAGRDHIDCAISLDKLDGWTFESGLPDYEDGSVDAITISHALMYVDPDDLPAVFAEFNRVLKPGGVLRITEDWTNNPDSERFGGYPGAVYLTTPEDVTARMKAVGLWASLIDPWVTLSPHPIIQRLHGEPPRVFHVEGVKP